VRLTKHILLLDSGATGVVRPDGLGCGTRAYPSVHVAALSQLNDAHLLTRKSCGRPCALALYVPISLRARDFTNSVTTANRRHRPRHDQEQPNHLKKTLYPLGLASGSSAK